MRILCGWHPVSLGWVPGSQPYEACLGNLWVIVEVARNKNKALMGAMALSLL